MKKYPKIKRIAHKENKGILNQGTIVVNEKLDGGNGRFCWWDEEDRILFGSRNVEYKNEEDTAKNFLEPIEFVQENINKDVIIELEEEFGDVVIFGEYMVPHTLSYNWENTPDFIGFDIWLGDEWATWQFCKEKFEEMNLPYAPEVYYGPAEDYEVGEDYEFPASQYRSGKPEGICIKNEDTGQRGKHRTPEFKEVHKGQNPNRDDSREPSDAEKLAWKYTTEARVLKWIHKYEDQGETIEMSLMPVLWQKIANDIIKEEGDEILLGNYDINTKQFRSEIASMTANVLEQYLSRPEDSVLNQRQE